MIERVFPETAPSEYEQRRLQNILRNTRRLRELGLDQPVAPPSAGKRPRSKPSRATPSVPSRRSSRSRRPVRYLSAEDGVDAADSDFEEEEEEEEEEKEEEEEYVRDVPRRKRIRAARIPPRADVLTEATTKVTMKATTKATPDATCTLGGVSCELAKTGRATCRKCREKIAQGVPRVGMEAWIMGRQSMTWQCVPCYLNNLVVSYEKTGRSKCQLTGRNFSVKEVRVGGRSHTKTLLYTVESVRKVLEMVVRWMPLPQLLQGEEEILNINRIEGSDALASSDFEDVQVMLTAVKAIWHMQAGGGCVPEKSTAVRNLLPDKDNETILKPMMKDIDDGGRPPVGAKSGVKGEVEWKFGGHLCRGRLLPSKETRTHCFARTHKGNIKTLAKGKSYWAVVG